MTRERDGLETDRQWINPSATRGLANVPAQLTTYRL